MAAKRSRFHVELDALLLQLSATGIEVCGREAEVIDRAPVKGGAKLDHRGGGKLDH